MEIHVRLKQLPAAIGAVISVDPDGDYNAYINSALSREAQLRALAHELLHAAREDLYSDEPIEDVERFDSDERWDD